MFRTVCLSAILAICCVDILQGQSTRPVEPNRFRISSSPRNRLPSTGTGSRSSTVTPAAFLKTRQDDSPQVPKSGSDEIIPSILTGKKSPTKQTKSPAIPKNSPARSRIEDQEIDPLKIKAKPIPSRKTGSGFQPPGNQTPSSFAPPKTGTPSTRSLPGSNGGTFQPGTGQLPASGSTTQQLTAPNGLQSPRNPGSGFGAAPGAATKQTGSVAPSVQTPRVADRSNSRTTVGSIPGSGNNRLGPKNPDLFSDQQLSPQLKVLTVGPKSVTVNKTGRFEIKVVNVGQVDANDVMIGIEIPAWVEIANRPDAVGGEVAVKDLGDGKGVVWNLSYLPAGRDAVIALSLEPRENRPFNLKTEWTTAPVSGESKIQVTQAVLATRITGPGEVKYGEKAVYTITIENTGNGAAESVNVALSDSLGGDSATVGLIPAGASKQFEVELTAGQAGAMKLEAFVRGDAGVKSEIAKEIVVRRAKLAVVATGPKFKYAGSALTYNISVENQGDAAARNIEAAALLPLNAEYISGLTSLSENDGRKIGWKIPEIPAGAKRDFIVTCLINKAGEARMEIGVRSDDGLTAGDIVNTKVEALADLKLEVVDPRGPQAVGREVTYELHIKNRGTKAARNVLVSGEFSDFIDPVAGSGARANIEQEGIISFDPIPEIKVGQSVVIKVVAKAYQPGTHTFRAIVQCKEQDIRKISEGTTKFFGEKISRPSGGRPAPQPARSQPAPASPTPQPTLPPTSFEPPGNSSFVPGK